jgi:hypothetical protein
VRLLKKPHRIAPVADSKFQISDSKFNLEFEIWNLEFIKMEADAGLEPATSRFVIECSDSN